MILILTLGFDEKFQYRSLMRQGKNVEKVIIVGGFKEEKAKKALESLESFLKTVAIPHETVEVDLRDFGNIVEKVGKVILSNAGKDIMVNLSGGMRLMILAVFSAFLLTGIDATVEIETEDLTKVYYFKISDVTLPSLSLTKDHLTILKAIKEGYSSANTISKETKIPLTTTWRRINELKKEGLIDESNKLTTKGELLLKIYGT
ncbi:CRISPR locus-related DNA-binding protein [Acidianus sulfidivorans JP7]|uniref:CRISPR locus-related DNA-binding protein n=1 Tax=Acidianus sulfidivorans JP7 TaxID=619593 RepID=A0A2U9IQ52_9CREN|nr:CRISPR-associated CARF protein Csa3 [Acidianus sulfidivorans]AWR98104.1 CRISPR locus-related DNA-binding protein [Acidianus sulfidivorans JP7]